MESIAYKGSKQQKSKRIGRKVGNLVAAILGVSITLVVVLCVLMFYRLTMSMMQKECVNGTNVLAYELSAYSGDDKTALLDALKQEMGCEFTIFHGDERAYTTIQQNGQRAVGTRLSSEIAEIVLRQGRSYVGQASILGEQHLCSYVPTYDANGQVDGLIFAGISMSSATQQIGLTVLLSCLAGIVLIIIGIMVVGGYIKKAVSNPLFRLTILAQTLEQGDLGLNQHQTMMVGIDSDDEIGILSQCFDNTISRLRNYIGEISNLLEAIAGGDLTAQITQEYVGDFASIRSSLNDILQKLNSTIGQIVSSAGHVSGGAEQMAAASQALSQGSMEQSGAVEALKETIRAVTERVRQTADNAQLAREQVDGMSLQIAEGNQKMQEMVNAMAEITDSSTEIEKIIKTIEDIAFQTNILALNAAVEAARAGTAGKGFAVVADEVRNLAAKSAEASQSTSALIGRSIAAVNQGTQIADATAKQLKNVVAGARGIEKTISGIAADAQTQAGAVEQIQDQIGQISGVVQTNSSTAEESAATSQELSAQAAVLKQLVKMFRLRQM
ncbi:HAMP domain-containing protein [Pseudoflavonifractor sp. 524-17]|uniref:methyl-accepting chemotaxis protein n=1 Tax=Pseudoflavonifractor sp. 524-17 TaxID=2304577 RepID=UPI0013796497|nr:methyl-accepting chemotaxis protein [Pseudoflavonifractor sp. 524-17]NCE64404.1 HAMP domain-containing protein [Pseudoflavonifractor sp. 524-17]